MYSNGNIFVTFSTWNFGFTTQLYVSHPCIDYFCLDSDLPNLHTHLHCTGCDFSSLTIAIELFIMAAQQVICLSLLLMLCSLINLSDESSTCELNNISVLHEYYGYDKCEYKSGKHLKCRILYYANSTSTFQLELCGDVETGVKLNLHTHLILMSPNQFPIAELNFSNLINITTKQLQNSHVNSGLIFRIWVSLTAAAYLVEKEVVVANPRPGHHQLGCCFC